MCRSRAVEGRGRPGRAHGFGVADGLGVAAGLLVGFRLGFGVAAGRTLGFGVALVLGEGWAEPRGR